MVELLRLRFPNCHSGFVEATKTNEGVTHVLVSVNLVRIEANCFARLRQGLLRLSNVENIGDRQAVVRNPVVWVEPCDQIIRFLLLVKVSGSPKVIDIINTEFFKFGHAVA